MFRDDDSHLAIQSSPRCPEGAPEAQKMEGRETHSSAISQQSNGDDIRSGTNGIRWVVEQTKKSPDVHQATSKELKSDWSPRKAMMPNKPAPPEHDFSPR